MDADSRRAFLKKAGTVAWAVPAMSAVNMTGAIAGGDMVNTSVTDPTLPPPPPSCACNVRLTQFFNNAQHILFYTTVSWTDDCDPVPHIVRFRNHPDQPGFANIIGPDGFVSIELQYADEGATVIYDLYSQADEFLASCSVTLDRALTP